MSEPVLVYSSRYCGWCSRAINLLNIKGVTPTIINVDTDRSLRAEMEQRSGRRTVPQVFIGERHIGGYDDLRALDDAGQLDILLPRGQESA